MNQNIYNRQGTSCRLCGYFTYQRKARTSPKLNVRICSVLCLATTRGTSSRLTFLIKTNCGKCYQNSIPYIEVILKEKQEWWFALVVGPCGSESSCTKKKRILIWFQADFIFSFLNTTFQDPTQIFYSLKFFQNSLIGNDFFAFLFFSFLVF